MSESPKTNRAMVSFEELAYSNMLVVQALVELLAEKGLLSQQEILSLVEKLKNEMKATSHRTQDFPGGGRGH